MSTIAILLACEGPFSRRGPLRWRWIVSFPLHKAFSTIKRGAGHSHCRGAPFPLRGHRFPLGGGIRSPYGPLFILFLVVGGGLGAFNCQGSRVSPRMYDPSSRVCYACFIAQGSRLCQLWFPNRGWRFLTKQRR